MTVGITACVRVCVFVCVGVRSLTMRWLHMMPLRILAGTPPPSHAPNMCKRTNRRWCCEVGVKCDMLGVWRVLDRLGSQVFVKPGSQGLGQAGKLGLGLGRAKESGLSVVTDRAWYPLGHHLRAARAGESIGAPLWCTSCRGGWTPPADLQGRWCVLA